MEHKHDDIDDLFQNSFENFEVQPPDELKKRIDKKLKFKSKRKIGPFIFFYGGIVLLLCLIFLYLQTNTSGSKKPNSLAQHSKFQSEKERRLLNETELTNSKKQQEKTSPYRTSGYKNSDQEHQFATLDSSSSQRKKINSGKSWKQDYSIKTVKENKLKAEKTYEENLNVENINLIHKSDSNITPILTIQSESKGAQHEISSSSDTALSVTSQDSLSDKQIEQSKISVLDSLPTSLKKFPLLIGLNSVYDFSFNQFKDKLIEVKEQNSFQFHLQASYLFNAKHGVSGGLNYFRSSERYTQTISMTDSTYQGQGYTYIYEDSIVVNTQTQDTTTITFVVDSTAYNIYQVKETTSEKSSLYRVSSVALPLLYYYQHSFNQHLYLDLFVGGIISFQRFKVNDSSNPLNSSLSIDKIGIKACQRSQLRYQFDRFGVSLNNTLTYDFNPVKFNDIKRNRFSIGVGIGMSWRF